MLHQKTEPGYAVGQLVKRSHAATFFGRMDGGCKIVIERKRDNRGQVSMLSLEGLVREDPLVRKIEQAIDFNEIYGIVEDLYCPDNGRPGVDPVVLFKIVFVQHLFGIPSLRQTLREIQDNNAYRWFIGYGLNEQIPISLR